MGLSSEHRRLYAEEIARSRAALDYWRANAPECYSPTTEARVAVADHLTAVEGLLREIGEAVLIQDVAGDGWTVAVIDSTDWAAFEERIDALLGSAATEGGVRWNTSIDGESPGRDVISYPVTDELP